jgi:predicted nucleotidyltransferase
MKENEKKGIYYSEMPVSEDEMEEIHDRWQESSKEELLDMVKDMDRGYGSSINLSDTALGLPRPMIPASNGYTGKQSMIVAENNRYAVANIQGDIKLYKKCDEKEIRQAFLIENNFNPHTGGNYDHGDVDAIQEKVAKEDWNLQDAAKILYDHYDPKEEFYQYIAPIRNKEYKADPSPIVDDLVHEAGDAVPLLEDIRERNELQPAAGVRQPEGGYIVTKENDVLALYKKVSLDEVREAVSLHGEFGGSLSENISPYVKNLARRMDLENEMTTEWKLSQTEDYPKKYVFLDQTLSTGDSDKFLQSLRIADYWSPLSYHIEDSFDADRYMRVHEIVRPVVDLPDVMVLSTDDNSLIFARKLDETAARTILMREGFDIHSIKLQSSRLGETSRNLLSLAKKMRSEDNTVAEAIERKYAPLSVKQGDSVELGSTNLHIMDISDDGKIQGQYYNRETHSTQQETYTLNQLNLLRNLGYGQKELEHPDSVLRTDMRHNFFYAPVGSVFAGDDTRAHEILNSENPADFKALAALGAKYDKGNYLDLTSAVRTDNDLRPHFAGETERYAVRIFRNNVLDTDPEASADLYVKATEGEVYKEFLRRSEGKSDKEVREMYESFSDDVKDLVRSRGYDPEKVQSERETIKPSETVKDIGYRKETVGEGDEKTVLYNRDRQVQGIEDTEEDILSGILSDIQGYIADNDLDLSVKAIALAGSRPRGDAKEDSDLDVVIQYSGDFHEDSLFNVFHDEENPLTYGNSGIPIDINPIEGSMDEYLLRSEKYDREEHQKDNRSASSGESAKEETSRQDALAEDWYTATAVISHDVLSGVPDDLILDVATRNDLNRRDLDTTVSKEQFDIFNLHVLARNGNYSLVREDDGDDYVLYKRIPEEEVRDMLRQDNLYNDVNNIKIYNPSVQALAERMRSEDRVEADRLEEKYGALNPHIADILPYTSDGSIVFVVNSIDKNIVSGRAVPADNLHMNVPEGSLTLLQLQYMRNEYLEYQYAKSPWKEADKNRTNPNVYYAYIGEIYPEDDKDVYDGIEKKDSMKLIDAAVKFDKYEAINPGYVYKDRPTKSGAYPMELHEGERYAVNIVSNREMEGVKNSYAEVYVKMSDKEVVENFRLLTDGDERLTRAAYDMSTPEVRELLDNSGIKIPDNVETRQIDREMLGEYMTGNSHNDSQFVIDMPGKSNPDTMESHLYSASGVDLGEASEVLKAGKSGNVVIHTTREDFEKSFDEGVKEMQQPLIPSVTFDGKPEHPSTADLLERNERFIKQRLGMIDSGRTDSKIARYSGQYERDIFKTMGKLSELNKMVRAGIEPVYADNASKKETLDSPSVETDKEETGNPKEWLVAVAHPTKDDLEGVPVSKLIEEGLSGGKEDRRADSVLTDMDLHSDPNAPIEAENDDYVVVGDDLTGDHVIYERVTEDDVRDMLRHDGYTDSDSDRYSASVQFLAEDMRQEQRAGTVESRTAADNLLEKYEELYPVPGETYHVDPSGKSVFVAEKADSHLVHGRVCPAGDTDAEGVSAYYTPKELERMRNVYFESKLTGNSKTVALDTKDNPNVYYAYVGDLTDKEMQMIGGDLRKADTRSLITAAAGHDDLLLVSPDQILKSMPDTYGTHYEGERYAVNVVSGQDSEGNDTSVAEVYRKMTDKEVVWNFEALTEGENRSLKDDLFAMATPEVQSLLAKSGVAIDGNSEPDEEMQDGIRKELDGAARKSSFFISTPDEEDSTEVSTHCYDTLCLDYGEVDNPHYYKNTGCTVIDTTKDELVRNMAEGRQAVADEVRKAMEEKGASPLSVINEKIADGEHLIQSRLESLFLARTDAEEAKHAAAYEKDIMNAMGRMDALHKMYKDAINKKNMEKPEMTKDNKNEKVTADAEDSKTMGMVKLDSLPDSEAFDIADKLMCFAGGNDSGIKFRDNGESAMTGSHSYSFDMDGKEYYIVLGPPAEDFTKYYGRNALFVREGDNLTDLTAGGRRLSEKGYNAIAAATRKAGEYIVEESRKMESGCKDAIDRYGTSGRLSLEEGHRPSVYGDQAVSSIGLADTWDGGKTVTLYPADLPGLGIPWEDLSFDEKKSVAYSTGYTLGVIDSRNTFVTPSENRSRLSETPETGKWHNYVINELRVYQRYGEILTDWKSKHSPEKFHSGMYNVPDSNPVKALVFTAFSESHDFVSPLYLSAKEIEESGLKVRAGSESVPVFDKTTGRTEDYYNIGQTDYLRQPLDSPVRQTFSKMTEDTLLYRHEGSRYLSDTVKLTSDDGKWIVPIVKETRQEGDPSARYDASDDVVRVDGNMRDLPSYEVLTALTDSLLIGDKIRQSHPHDSNYQSFATLMNDIRYNTPYPAEDGGTKEAEGERVPFFATGNSRSEYVRFRDDPVYTKDVLETAARTSDTIYRMSQGMDVSEYIDIHKGEAVDTAAAEKREETPRRQEDERERTSSRHM